MKAIVYGSSYARNRFGLSDVNQKNKSRLTKYIHFSSNKTPVLFYRTTEFKIIMSKRMQFVSYTLIKRNRKKIIISFMLTEFKQIPIVQLQIGIFFIKKNMNPT